VYKNILILSALLLLPHEAALGLTFKSDGTIVQKSGAVVKKSFADRFADQFFLDAPAWPKARGTGQEPQGYLGEDLLMPGTPLLVIQNIKKGDSYVDALMKQNGFSDKASLQRFIVANANPEFMAKLGLSEADAAQYVGNVDPSLMTGLSEEYAQQLARFAKEIENIVGENVESTIEDSVNEAVEGSVDDAVSDAVSDALDESFSSWWDSYVQDLIDSGATILEQTDNSVTYTFD